MKISWFKLSRFTDLLGNAAKVLATIALLGTAGLAQQTVAMLEPAIPAAPVLAAVSPRILPEAPSSQHQFWDNENRVLFGAVVAGSAADFAVTYSNLQNGGRELNPVTRILSGSTTGLAVNFVGQAAGVVGLSYFFHKTGHHKLERLTPLLSFGASAYAVSYGLMHR
jgi:hypothetical protein